MIYFAFWAFVVCLTELFARFLLSLGPFHGDLPSHKALMRIPAFFAAVLVGFPFFYLAVSIIRHAAK